ncbi:hypothetical protein [Nocardioides bigeumensis]|uniref:Uncharacterized protein n=1 Tax=Nocardioides bigeumensis TaxID=433657 RepID=A0ABN2YBX7_9ACTN
MTTEQLLRTHFDETTREVRGGPTLQASLNAGRRGRRRTLVAGAAGSALAVAVVATTGVLVSGGSPPSADAPATDPAGAPAAAPAVEDIVADADLDELLQTVVVDHLGDTPRLKLVDVFPSDWDHNGPMPDADHADATDWQAAYTVGDTDMLLFVGYPMPGEPALDNCSDAPDGSACSPVAGGLVVENGSLVADGGPVRFTTTYVGARPGVVVNLIETVPGVDVETASSQRVLTRDGVLATVTDPRLTFPLPKSRR